MKPHRILVVGAGQLGSRHLQALAKLPIPLIIDVVDPSTESLSMSKNRFNEIASAGEKHSITWHTSFDTIGKEIYLCIIATTAKVRAAVTNSLLGLAQVKTIVFEKILFQKLSDFDSIAELLEKKNVSAWVNCPRRMFALYRELKSIMHNDGPITLSVVGGEWGLACNAIHFIDLAAFISGTVEYVIDCSGIDKEPVQEKRKGFVEISGLMNGVFANGSKLILSTLKKSSAPHYISIISEQREYVIDEGANTGMKCDLGNTWKREALTFKIPFQSELTDKVATSILLNNVCDLTSFQESCKLHKPFLDGLKRRLELLSGQSLEACPIT
jgi:hypothetical protein